MPLGSGHGRNGTGGGGDRLFLGRGTMQRAAAQKQNRRVRLNWDAPEPNPAGQELGSKTTSCKVIPVSPLLGVAGLSPAACSLHCSTAESCKPSRMGKSGSPVSLSRGSALGRGPPPPSRDLANWFPLVNAKPTHIRAGPAVWGSRQNLLIHQHMFVAHISLMCIFLIKTGGWGC